MCGIAGAVGGSPDRDVLERQLRQLEHRGPDSWGVHMGSQGAVGQTRLAVIDLVTGDPPIANDDGTIGVVLNGEIYNFRELRAELLGRGHRLHTQGDTEVLAHLAEELEPVDLARRLEGMFAFAVWDETRQRLVLGRDRLGKKPLYYATTPQGTLVFGSEIKAVLAHPDVPRRVDDGAVPAYLTFGYVPTPRTFYEGIVSVPPGHVLTVQPGRAPVLERYWDPRPSPGAASPSLEDAAVEVRRLLTAAVDRRLIADVPLGAFLSGGIDSSSIVGIMAGLSSKPVRTFTIGFEDDEGYDERPYAAMIAERFATDHVEFVVKPDALDLLERLVWHHDQPFGDSSAIPTFLLSELTRKHVTVALCGDGGDELFAGYERFSGALVHHRYTKMPASVRGLVRTGARSLPPRLAGGRAGSLQRFLDRSEMPLLDAFMAWISYLGPEWRSTSVVRPDDWGRDDYAAVWQRSEGAPLLDRLLDLNLRTYLLDDLLPKVDRMAMAHALEVRTPFLDRELVEYSLSLPPQLKARGWSRKRVLKAAVRDLLPAEVLRRRKRGFGVPLDRWFRTDLRSYVRSTLGAPDARVLAHVHADGIQRLLDEHDRAARNHGLALWALLTLESFLRREE